MYALLNLTVTQSMTTQKGTIKKRIILNGGTFGKSRKEWVLLRLQIGNLMLPCLTTKEMSILATERAEVEYKIETHPKYGQTFKLLDVTQVAPKIEMPKTYRDCYGSSISVTEWRQNKFDFKSIEYNPDFENKIIKFNCVDYNGDDKAFDMPADDFANLFNNNNIHCAFRIMDMEDKGFRVSVEFDDEVEIQQRDFYEVTGLADSQKKMRYICIQYIKKILV